MKPLAELTLGPTGERRGGDASACDRPHGAARTDRRWLQCGEV